MRVNQKEGVFNAVSAFCAENDIELRSDEAFKPTKEQRKTITHMVAVAMHAGEIELSEAASNKYNSLELKEKYCSGLVSNWLRKDERLNGGVEYEIKNPGSRAGNGDEVVRELRKLRKTLTDADQKAEVDAEIDKRLEAIKAKKAQSVEINEELIPEELHGLINKS